MFTKDPDRQPRRDRLPRHQDRPQDGHRHGGRVFRRRQGRAPRRAGRRGRATSAPRPVARVYLRGRQDHRRLQADRRQAVHPGYGFLSRERGLRAAGRGRGHRLHRPQALFDRRDGRQDRVQEAGRARPGQHAFPAATRRSRRAEQAVEIAKDIGYPVMIKAIGRRRRQGPARGLQRQGGLRGLHRPAATRRATASATTASSSRSSSRSRATSRSRCWATRTATWST